MARSLRRAMKDPLPLWWFFRSLRTAGFPAPTGTFFFHRMFSPYLSVNRFFSVPYKVLLLRRTLPCLSRTTSGLAVGSWKCKMTAALSASPALGGGVSFQIFPSAAARRQAPLLTRQAPDKRGICARLQWNLLFSFDASSFSSNPCPDISTSAFLDRTPSALPTLN